MQPTVETYFEEEWSAYGNSGGATYYADEDAMFHLTTDIDMYSLPVIILLGVPVNCIALVVFLTKTFRHTSCGAYLVVKSVSDTAFLICTFLVWLERLQIHAIHTQGVCQLVVYFTYVSALISVWCVAALTVENLIRIRYPFKVETFCTLRKARWSIGVTITLACALYTPTLWINMVAEIDGYQACQRNHNMETLSSIYTYLDTALTFFLPSVAILIMLALSFEAMWVSKARNQRMHNGLRVSLSVVMQQQITRMLSAVSVSFIAMSLPSHIARVTFLVMICTGKVPDLTPEQYLAQHLFQLLYYLTFSVNIFIYIIFSLKFRRIMCSCVVSRNYKQVAINTQV